MLFSLPRFTRAINGCALAIGRRSKQENAGTKDGWLWRLVAEQKHFHFHSHLPPAGLLR